MAASDRVTTPTRYGPVERRLRANGVTGFGLLLQAAAIDRAGRNLLDHASATDGENRDQPRQPIPANRNPAREAPCPVNGPAAERRRPSTSAATPQAGKTTPHPTSRSASAPRTAVAAVPMPTENHRPGRIAPQRLVGAPDREANSIPVALKLLAVPMKTA
jgi:hypothetical protein